MLLNTDGCCVVLLNTDGCCVVLLNTDGCCVVLFQFECGGMVLEEAPDKVAESFRLFLQGMGYSE